MCACAFLFFSLFFCTLYMCACKCVSVEENKRFPSHATQGFSESLMGITRNMALYSYIAVNLRKPRKVGVFSPVAAAP